MKSFKLNDRMQIVAKYEKTRSGFRHRATLLVDNVEVDEVTVPYLNRTWESYNFESAINKLIDKSPNIAPEMKQKFKDKLAGRSHEETKQQFRTIGMVSAMGDIIGGKSRVEKNIWKQRMIKAGLGDAIQMPKDWDKLPEDVKEARLNKVTDFLLEKKKGKGVGSKKWVKEQTKI